MIIFKRCSDSSVKEIYEAYINGYIDYPINMDIPEDMFYRRYFGGPEGNSMELSFIAYDDDTPIGLLLSGIRVFDGSRTMHLSALAVKPGYRNQGIGTQLMRFHNQTAIDEKCDQMLLEVLDKCPKTMKFHEKRGYSIVYQIDFYSHNDVSQIIKKSDGDLHVHRGDIEVIKYIRKLLPDTHLNWQNEVEYVELVEDKEIYTANYKGVEIGYLAISRKGGILFLWVAPDFRRSGVATELLAHAIKHMGLKKLGINFPNNIWLDSFVKRMEFKKIGIHQYEMIKLLYYQ